MSQRMVYHWKHGWIPLDMAAALSKAHGSKTGAAKLLGHGAPAHGAPAAGDGKSEHPAKSYADLLREADARRTKPLQSTVDARFQNRSAIRNKSDAELADIAGKLRPGSEAHTSVLAEMRKRAQGPHGKP